MRCTVYKSPHKVETYVYLPADQTLEILPEALLAQFGEPQKVLDVDLDAERKLARVDVVKVMQAITEKGYFVQLPPPPGVPIKR